MASSLPAGAGKSTKPPTREYVVRNVVGDQGAGEGAVGIESMVYNVLRFPASCGEGSDPTKWGPGQVSMARLGNATGAADGLDEEDEMPTHGAGSIFGWAAREQLRKERIARRQARHGGGKQSWALTVNTASEPGNNPQSERPSGKQSARAFHSTPGEDAGRHADYWMLAKSGNEFHATKLGEWHQFRPVRTRKTLGIDEAEEHFKQRKRVLNQFALKAQIQKQLAEQGEEGATAPVGSRLKVRDAGAADEDEDEEYDEDMNEEVEEMEISERRKKGGGKQVGKGSYKKGGAGKSGRTKAAPSAGKERRKRRDSRTDRDDDEVAAYESDDGDEEGKELDYLTDDESESDSGEEEGPGGEKSEEHRVDEALVSVADENAMSDEAEGDEEMEVEEEEEEEANGGQAGSPAMKDEEEPGKKPRADKGSSTAAKLAKRREDQAGEDGGDSHGSDSDEDDDPDKAKSVLFLQPVARSFAPGTRKRLEDEGKRPASPSSLAASTPGEPSIKRARVDVGSGSLGSGGGGAARIVSAQAAALVVPLAAHGAADAADEELVKHCLLERACSTRELVKKLSRAGVPNETTVANLLGIINRLKAKQFTKTNKDGKPMTYFTLKHLS